MKTAGKIVAESLYTLKDMAKEGVSTIELDEVAESIIKKHGATPNFKGYHGFPGTICASVNDQVVHGIPSKDVILKNGDIISIDMGCRYKGMHGDSALTVAIGDVSDEITKLLEVTEKSLYAGIEKMLPGALLEEVSGAIEDVAVEAGLGIVREYGGHGIGRNLHEAPFVYNYRTNKPTPTLKKGMTICIEPMLNLGCDEVHTLDDGWTVVTNDGKPSAHFENAVYISEDGPVLLTTLD